MGEIGKRRINGTIEIDIAAATEEVDLSKEALSAIGKVAAVSQLAERSARGVSPYSVEEILEMDDATRAELLALPDDQFLRAIVQLEREGIIRGE